MNYQEYIDLGFKRIDINDVVEFRNCGYSGYILVKKITKGVTIEVDFNELEKPVLFIKKKGSQSYCFIDLLPEQVKSTFSKS